MLGMAFVKSWTAMTGMRILLGIPEAALMPGAAYLISCWYPRRSMATRTTIFFMTSIILGGLANPVMYVISLLHGRGGYHGWSWIFILCGIITVVIGMAGLVLLPDFPDRAPFLTEEERHMVLTRIERDRADSEPDSMTMQKFWLYIRDPKIWLFGFFLGSATLGGYSHAYFQPRLLATIGFNNVESQLLTTPPPFWALLQSMVVATLADRYGWRAGAVAFNSVTLIVGTAMYSQLPLSMKAARYAGLFLSYGGAQSNVPLVISWSQTAIRAQSKRGFTSAVIIAWGGIGGILAGAAFIEKEAPKQFPTGVFLTMGMNAAVVVLAIGLHFWMRHQNRRADRGEIIIEGSEDFRYQ
jgi:MFS family permease